MGLVIVHYGGGHPSSERMRSGFSDAGKEVHEELSGPCVRCVGIFRQRGRVSAEIRFEQRLSLHWPAFNWHLAAEHPLGLAVELLPVLAGIA